MCDGLGKHGTIQGCFGMLMRVILTITFAITLVACATRPEIGYLSPVAESQHATPAHTILVATTRQTDPRPGTLFNGERSPALNFASATVSIPPSHVSGNIELASTAPGNPERDFVVRQAQYLDGEARFVSELNAQLSEKPPGQRKVLLFIHGYNTMFAEGLYRFAQIVHDSEAPSVPILFSWASRGKIGEYIYDNNSATAARDDLEKTIRLALASDAEEVDILAHSMGNWVTVEALRQIRISGDLPQKAKIGAILLAAPDIDVDVFKSEMRRFGKPEKPYYILVSKDDKALKASSFLAGDQPRLGADANTAELNALGAVVIDLSDVSATDPTNHDKFAQLAALAPKLRQVLKRGIPGNSSQMATLGGAIQIVSGQ